jgi:hypothetical protein
MIVVWEAPCGRCCASGRAPQSSAGPPTAKPAPTCSTVRRSMNPSLPDDWLATPPSTALRNVHFCVLRLRTFFAPGQANRSLCAPARFCRARTPSAVLRSTAEIVSLSLIPSHCRAFHAGSRRASCTAIGALNEECAGAYDLRPVATKGAGLQYRNHLILGHLVLGWLQWVQRICLMWLATTRT